MLRENKHTRTSSPRGPERYLRAKSPKRVAVLIKPLDLIFEDNRKFSHCPKEWKKEKRDKKGNRKNIVNKPQKSSSKK